MHLLRNSHPLPKYDPRNHPQVESYLRQFGHSQVSAITGIHVKLTEENQRRLLHQRIWRKAKRSMTFLGLKWCALPDPVHYGLFGALVFALWLALLWAFVEKMN